MSKKPARGTVAEKTFALPSIEHVAKRMWAMDFDRPIEQFANLTPTEQQWHVKYAAFAVAAMRDQCESESVGGPGAMPSTLAQAPTPQPKESRQSYYGDGLQPWDLIKSLGMGAAFAAGNVIKYVGRYDKKGGLEDLRKCRWYLDRLIEIVEIVESASTATGSMVGKSIVGDSK